MVNDNEHSSKDFNGEDAYQNQEEYVNKGFWAKFKETAANIPFVTEVVALYYSSVDAHTPTWAKTVAFGALAYFILPIDAIPDFTPILGFTDDAGAIAAAFTSMGQMIKEEHKKMAAAFLADKEYVNRESTK